MKTNVKRITAIALTAALVLSISMISACNEEQQQEVLEFDSHEAVVERAGELAKESSEVYDAFPDVEVTQKVRWMSWYPMDEKSPAAEVFRARYGVPAPKNENDDTIIERIPVVYAQRYERLALAVSGDTSPDMFQFEDRFYPWGVHQNIFRTIDGVIDLEHEIWDKTRDVIELFKWGGKNYAPVTQLAISAGVLFYRRSTMSINGFDDPEELWRKNQWTWTKFEEQLESFSDPQNKKWGVMGFYIDEATIATTGTPLIGIVDGKLQHNMDHGNIERATTFMQRLADNDWRHPYHTETNNTLDKQALRARNILFWNDGPWEYQETLQKQITAENRNRGFVGEDGKTIYFDDDVREEIFNDIGIVPWPRDPNSTVHYQRGKQDAMMLVSGAQNINGYKAWVTSMAIAAQDERMDEVGRDKLKRDYNWTELQLNTLDEILEMPVIFDFKNGIGEDVSDATRDSNVENLTKPIITEGDSYTQRRDAERNVIITRINLMNERVDQQS
jgi:multiple sugar transport system substrate-binding protein